MLRWEQNHTVDGRNPASVDRWCIPLNVCRVSTIQGGFSDFATIHGISDISQHRHLLAFPQKKQADGGHKTISDGSMVPDFLGISEQVPKAQAILVRLPKLANL